MSYGCRGSSGTTVVELDVHPVRSDRPSRRSPAPPRLFCGRCASRCARRVERAGLVGRRECATPLRVVWVVAPPRNSAIDILVGHGLHDVRSGDEHVARAFDHDGEVGDGRRVDRAAGARPQDHRDLRHDAGRQDVAQEDVGVAAERHDAFLDPRAAGIVEPDDRRADLHRQIHDLADLLGVRLRQRSAEDREVLAEDEDRPAVDLAVAGDDAVAEERFGRGRVAVRDERVELDERSRVEQQVESLARRQLAGVVLLRDARRAAALARRGAHLLESREPLRVRRHRSTLLIGLSLRKDSAIISAATRPPTMPRISTDSVNNSQSVWITGVPGMPIGGAYHDGTRSPPRRPLCRPQRILR